MEQGRIIKLVSNDYTVLKDGKEYVCKSRGKFRKMKLSPLVGDIVKFDQGQHYILEVCPRKNELVRPPVSNVDQVVIVTSVKEPELQTNLLDKLLLTVSYHRMKPIICFTKLDLLTREECEQVRPILQYYEKIGYEVYFNTELDEIITLFDGKVTAFTGQSGAGKSTLLNRLDTKLHLATGEISLALGRGRHTTRHVELLPIGNGLVADTPGFFSIPFRRMKKQELKDYFIEFQKYQSECRYKDCMHDKDDHCKIKELVKDGVILKSRYDNYIKFLREKEMEKESW